MLITYYIIFILLFFFNESNLGPDPPFSPMSLQVLMGPCVPVELFIVIQ